MLEIYERDEYGLFTLVSEREFFSFVTEGDGVFNEFKDEVFAFFMTESFIENFSDGKLCCISDFYHFDIHFDKVGLFILIKLIGYYENENVFCYVEEGY